LVLAVIVFVGVRFSNQQKTAPPRLPGAHDVDAVRLPGAHDVAPATIFYFRPTPEKLPALATDVTITNNSGGGYPGLDFSHSSGYVPPDTCGAAGPSNYVEIVNQSIAIYSPKATGTMAVLDSLNHFFFTVGGLSRASAHSSLSDPIIIYDELISRFIVGDQDVDFNLHVSNFVIAVSKTSNPTTLTTADWNFYSISTTETGFDADYPGNFGYNADAFVFTLNMFVVAAGSDHVLVTSVNAADLAAGVSQASLHSFKNDLADFSVRPTTMHGSVTGDPMWLVTEHGNDTSIDVIKMTSVLSTSASFAYTNIAVNAYSPVVSPLNPDGSVITARIDSRILKAAEANNKIVATHAVSASATQDVARWYIIDVSSATPVLSDQGNVSAGNNTYLYFPSIDISSSSGTIGMTYMRSGTDTTTDFMSMYITGRAPSDPAGTMETSVSVPAGTGQANYSDFAGAGSRAGDLSGINVDPSDGSFWAANEYATSTGGGQAQANWGTAIANFTVPNPAVQLNSVVSELSHGSAGTFDITLPLTGTRGVECRTSASLGPGNYTLVFTFTNNLTSVASASVTAHDPTSGTGAVSGSVVVGPTASLSAKQCAVTLTNVSNAQYINVILNNVMNSAGNSGNVVGPQMGVLIGDVNATGGVDGNDVSGVQSHTRQQVNSDAIARFDVNATGGIDGNDVSLTQSHTRTSLPSPP
jgi:hypothetical protein